uniref:Uncharacterized protein n=1 Tax=Salix viminalis TaxID=40686 RepID=A0A6N2KQ83_SALVM
MVVTWDHKMIDSNYVIFGRALWHLVLQLMGFDIISSILLKKNVALKNILHGMRTNLIKTSDVIITRLEIETKRKWALRLEPFQKSDELSIVHLSFANSSPSRGNEASIELGVGGRFKEAKRSHTQPRVSDCSLWSEGTDESVKECFPGGNEGKS